MSLRSTSIRACRREPSRFARELFASKRFSPCGPVFKLNPSSSTGMMRQLLNIGKSSPRVSSVTLISSRKSGREVPFRALVRDVRMASSCWASLRNWAIVCAISTLNQSSDSG